MKWLWIILAAIAVVALGLNSGHMADRMQERSQQHQQFKPCIMDPETGEPFNAPCDEH